MNLRFDALKATQVACRFIEKENGQINIMKLTKLMYLLDRISFHKRGIPVLGGVYFSMRNGPVTSEVLDLVNSGCLYFTVSDWTNFISDRQDHMVGFKEGTDAAHDRLSESELRMIDQLYEEHGGKNQWQLVEWCHQNCQEWQSLPKGRSQIPIEAILSAVGKTDDQIKRIVSDAQEAESLEMMLA